MKNYRSIAFWAFLAGVGIGIWALGSGGIGAGGGLVSADAPAPPQTPPAPPAPPARQVPPVPPANEEKAEVAVQRISAEIRAKYGPLLKRIYVSGDLASYGEVRDFGWWSGTSYMGYCDLPAGNWVYLHPHWYIFDKKPVEWGSGLTEQERGLFRECREKEKVPVTLIQAYAAYAQAAKAGDVGRIRSACLPQSVAITEAARTDKDGEHGQGINLPFLKSQFTADVLTARQDSTSCWLLRTGSTALWFVQTAAEGWKIYSALDKPIE